MSVVTSRSSVKRVDGATAAAAGAAGAVILAQLLAAAFASRRNTRERNRSTVVLPGVLPVRSNVEVRESLERLTSRDLASETVATPVSLQIAVRPDEVRPVVDELVRCDNPVERASVVRQLSEVVSASHKRVMSDAAAEACRVASVAVGFTDVQMIRSAESQVVRIVADDPAGRSIVSEIRCAEEGIHVDSEVVGVTDGSCVRIMSDFDNALEHAGLKSEHVVRKPTGGVCALAFSQSVINERWRKKTGKAAKVATKSSRGAGARPRQAKIGGRR